MSDTKRILVKRIKSAIPTNLFATLLSLRDVSGTPTSVNSFIQWDSDLQKFTFSASTISDAVLSNLVDSAVSETVDSDYINSILGTSVNAATLNNQPGSHYLDYNNLTNVPAAGTDSSTVSSIIIEDVDKTFIDALNVDANTLGGNDSSYYLNYNNFTNTPGTDSSTVRTIADEQIALADIQDLANVDITGITNNQVLKWDSANSRFIAANDANSGGGEGGIDSDVVIALVDSDYIQARVTLDGVGIDSATASTIADTRITSTVNKSFVDNLGVDAATLGGRDSSYFTNASNISSGTLDSSHIPTLALGTDTTGNYVSDVSGTANEIEVSSSTGSVTIGLPSNVTIDSNLTVGGYIGGPAVFTIDPAAIGDSTGKVVILGDLQVDGVQTTINSTTVSISDKNIVLADSATDSSQANGAGITVNGANAKITYTSVDDKWVFNKVPYYNTNRLLTTADDLHDSDAVQGQIDASLSVLDTHDSAAVVGQINATVDATFVRPLARAALVAGNNITYDSSTGVIASTAAGGTDSSTVVSIADSRIGVASIGDLSDVDLTGIATDRVLKWDGSKFIVALDATGSGGAGIALTDLSANNTAGKFGSLSYSSASGVFTYTGPDSNDVKTVTGIPYNNLTGTPNILDSNHVGALIDSALLVLDTHDSAAVVGQINNEVTINYINSLTGVLDADTLGGHDSSYYTNAGNLTGTLDSARIPTLVLGTDTTGNYVVDVSGTTNQIEVTHTPSAGSTPVIGLPSNVTIDSNLTVGGYIGGPAVFTIDPAAIGDSTGKVVILGDLQVDGLTTTINSTTVSISDKNIILADSAADSSQANGAGITVNGSNAKITYTSVDDRWTFNKAPYYNTNRLLTTADDTHDEVAVHDQIDSALVNAGTLTDTIDSSHIPTLRTNDVNEGSNLYYTTNRADSDIGVIVNAAYVNALNVNADTVDSLHASQFLRSDSDDTVSANLTVTGTITTGSGNNTTVIKADTGTYDNYSIEHDLDGTLVTLSTATVIDTYTHNSAKTSIEYLIHLEHNTLAETQITKILATYKGSGTDVQFTEFGEIFTGDSSLGALTIDENSGSIRLLLDPREDEDVISKVVRTIIV